MQKLVKKTICKFVIFILSMVLLMSFTSMLDASDLPFDVNSLLKNVYYVYGENATTWVASTGFAMEYNGKVYLITAGHVLNNDTWGLHENLRFKANGNSRWVYPRLIAYYPDYMSKNDYAIFYSSVVKSGLKVDTEGDSSVYVLGCKKLGLNTIRDCNTMSAEGESGSPVVDAEGEVTGISTTNYIAYKTLISTIQPILDN